MQPAQWKTFIAQFAALSRRQRLAGIALLRGGGSQDAAVALIENVARQRFQCPACNSSHAHRHGRRRTHPFARNIIEGNTGSVPTSDDDIA